MKRILSVMAGLSLCLFAAAAPKDTVVVKNFRYAGPFETGAPFYVDTTDVKGKAYNDTKAQLDAAFSPDVLNHASVVSSLPAISDRNQLHFASFSVETMDFAKVDINVEGIKDCRIFLDGKKNESGKANLEPGTHEIVIKYLTDKESSDEGIEVSVASEQSKSLRIREDGRRIYSLDLNTQLEGCAGVSLSPGGLYYSIRHSLISDDGRSTAFTEVFDTATGELLIHTADAIRWMPTRDEYYTTQRTVDGRNLVSVDPRTKKETVIVKNVPDGRYEISPTEDFLIYTMTQEGPKEGDVHQILTPDDRQPGWRDRSYISLYDIATGMMRQLTFGYHDSYPMDLSDDGRYLLFSVSRYDLSKRPTSYSSVYLMDLQTSQVECLIEKDGFVGGGQFSPDGKQILFRGSPEAFDKIGMVLPEGRIPNAYDYQLYLFDIASKKVTPLTKNFDPSPQSVVWSRYDGKIYFSAEDKDCYNLFRLDPRNGRFERLDNKDSHLDYFAIALKSPALIYSGDNLDTHDKAYLMDTKTGKQKLVCDFHEIGFSDVDVAQGGEYEFTSSRGDRINGFYVLPANFDPSKKYPMIVHYYGGCSPSLKYFAGSYSPHLYSSQGYVFYVVNPSGASGFGQEFASRHVNTAGDGVAEDIIEGVKHFCADHPFVDASKIGCFSASYGGFMTQLLLASTDIFATGISHAGISDHTSYWGEGYWGYSYSEVSMADSYPWTRKDLYVDRSPLYFADKIKDPILFLHGSADTNVPIGESIQMFTAMQLLGTESAFVVVDGENHGISDYAKKRQWLRTISAWFAKYLKDDSTWWDELYPPKEL
ncbi:MAG: S9 family peptidase [Bacteroidales bacterium]|nr:S9 family peptidase [Bacteroidales bacterium]